MESAYVARRTHCIGTELQVNYISWYIRCLFKSTSMHAAATFNISRYVASFKANKSLFFLSSSLLFLSLPLLQVQSNALPFRLLLKCLLIWYFANETLSQRQQRGKEPASNYYICVYDS